VGDQVVIERGVGESVNGLGDILTGSFNGDIVVVGEVDTGLLLGGVVGDTEKFALETSVGGTGDVLAVAPLAISRTAGRGTGITTTTTAATCTSWMSVSMGIERPGGSTIWVPD
jgi:hypothetical protein